MSAHTKADTHPPQASTGEGKLTVVTETIVKEYIWSAWGSDEVACTSCQWEFSVNPNTVLLTTRYMPLEHTDRDISAVGLGVITLCRSVTVHGVPLGCRRPESSGC